MNPIVAIASSCPACCCTVDSWTLIKGLIRFSSPEDQNKLMKSQYNLTQTSGNWNEVSAGHMKLWLGSPVTVWQTLRCTNKMGLLSSSQDSSDLIPLACLMLKLYNCSLMAAVLLPKVGDAGYPSKLEISL